MIRVFKIASFFLLNYNKEIQHGTFITAKFQLGILKFLTLDCFFF